MSQGSDALKENDLPTAEQRYRAALVIRGDSSEALKGLNTTIVKVPQSQVAQCTAAPVTSDIQNASLLFNTGDDAGLYHQLILLGDRSDLSDEQRNTIQTIWTNWALRRANQAAASAIRSVHSPSSSRPPAPPLKIPLSFGLSPPDAHAPNFLYRPSLSFKSQDMTTATVSDYRSAVGRSSRRRGRRGRRNLAPFRPREVSERPRDALPRRKVRTDSRQRHPCCRLLPRHTRRASSRDPVAEVVAELSHPQPANHLATPAQNKELATLLITPDSATAKSPLAESAKLSPPSYGNSASVQAQLQTPQQPGSSQPLTNQPLGVYGTYVPYVAPTQISDNSSRKLPPQSDATETLPTARHVPNAQAAPNVAHSRSLQRSSRWSEQPTRRGRPPAHTECQVRLRTPCLGLLWGQPRPAVSPARNPASNNIGLNSSPSHLADNHSSHPIF